MQTEPTESTPTIWTFSRQVSQRLLAWSSFSIGTGLALLLLPWRFWQGVGVHFAGWGIIDALIALVGWVNTRKNSQKPDAQDATVQANESQKLRRLLWLNAGLDVFYVLGGVWLWQRKGGDDPHWRGQGLGIIIQGGFLLIFDVIHAILGRKI